MEPEGLRMEIEAFFREMGIPEDRIFYSSNYFGMLDIYLGNGMEIYALSVFIAVICAIVIYNIFYISVMGKMREYGRLKVLGATPEQLKRVVKRERRLLTVSAIPPGLLLAAGIALAAVPGYWSWRDNLKSAVMISFLTYGMVLIATKKPLSMVGKVSAIEAVRTIAYSGQQGRTVSGKSRQPLTMLRLARMNFSRNRKKAIVTLLSLSLTGILLFCISAYANSVDIKEMAQSQFGDRSQYLLQYEDYAGREFYEMQKENPLGEALREELAAIPGVDYVTAYSMASVEIPAISGIPGNREHEPFIVRGIDREDMARMYTNGAVLEGKADYRQMAEQSGILVCPAGSALKEIYKTTYQVGDTITLSCYNGQTKTYTVTGIVKDIPIGSTAHFFILPEEELSVLYPEISDFTGYVNVHTKEDGRELRKAVFDTVSDERVAVSGLEDIVAVLESGMQGELKRDYCFLIFIFVFSLINLANTLITNLLARQQEFGVFAAELFLVQTVFSVCAVRYSKRFSLVERIKATD